MTTTLAILTIGVVPISEVMPLLTEHISETQITHMTLLGNKTYARTMAEYGPDKGETDTIMTVLADQQLVRLSRRKVEIALQGVIEVLDNQGFDVIILMSNGGFRHLQSHNAMLLEPERIVPPLVASIVAGHQVGVMLPLPEFLEAQHNKWAPLSHAPFYALANPLSDDDNVLLDAGRDMIDKGADVLVLDCPGYHQKHRDLLQKTLDVPVLLSNVLVARLASELMD